MESDLRQFADYLDTIIAENKFHDERNIVLERLRGLWSQLSGSSYENTTPDKLCRAESLDWQRPNLSFCLERHGGTVNGSSRADVHYWVVDLQKGSAAIEREGYRQLDPRSPPLNTKALAAELADLILQGVDDPRLEWQDGRTSVILVMNEIIPETYARTTQDRRKRFRSQMKEVMEERGWKLYKKGNRMGFE
jgi:hypothetical protein